MCLPASYYAGLLVVSTLASAAIAVLSWQRRGAAGTLPFGILMMAVSLWSLSDLMRLENSAYSTMVYWDQISYVGIVLVPPAWLAFCLQYTGKDAYLNRQSLILLSIEPLLTLILVFTNQRHGMIWADLSVVALDQHLNLAHSYGSWFWVNAVYSYALLLAGAVLLFRYALQSSNLFRDQAKVLALGAAIPLVSNVLYLAGRNPSYPLDLTTLAFSLTGLVVAWGLFRFKLLDLVPVAYDEVFTSMADGVVVLDAQNRIVDVNPAVQRMAGLSYSQAVGKSVIDLPLGKPNLMQRYLNVREADAEIELSGPLGQRFLDLRISPLHDGQGDFLGRLVVFRDMTDRKRAQEGLLRAHQELEKRVEERTSQLAWANSSLKSRMADLQHSENKREQLIAELEVKNAEMERFTYTVSHDLRSPLITIQGFIGFLKQDLQQGRQSRVDLDLMRIEEAVNRMDLLLRDTLELSRIGRVTDPPQDVNFIEIVRDSLNQVSMQVGSSGAKIRLAESFPAVHVDRLRMVEALANLIENSIKYMGSQASPEIEIGWNHLDGDTAFFVRDNGIGIDPGQHKKVFELFYKVDKKSEGTGAGLAIVHRIIEVHGGRIWIESEPGQGCSVFFTLPLAGSVHEPPNDKQGGEPVGAESADGLAG